jgi:hypothetical protein
MGSTPVAFFLAQKHDVAVRGKLSPGGVVVFSAV